MQRGLVGSEMCIRDRYQTTEPESDSLRAVFCGNRIFVYSTKFEKISLSIFDITTKSVTQNTPPFNGINNFANIQYACYNTTLYTHLAALGTTFDNKIASQTCQLSNRS
eukprot:TRINITY_DN6559_c0_g1_i3.p2 TRINITY_DN6559_c0_g1~~TRINITY_DN6559_c0_g1_i3.p2  ORF type:complete len:109 (+),score=18.03 TRINITY_DN6559_c0_g1_i3:164-490(+)